MTCPDGVGEALAAFAPAVPGLGSVSVTRPPHAAVASVFLVDGAPRVSIAEERTRGVDWTDGWHEVRLVREPASGLVEFYFDDLEKPIMTAHDKTFPKGRLGLGSFDDKGMFDDLTIRPR